MERLFGLPDLPRELMNYTGGRTVSYRMLYNRVLNGALPARRLNNGRWVIDRKDLPAIAESLGLSKGIA